MLVVVLLLTAAATRSIRVGTWQLEFTRSGARAAGARGQLSYLAFTVEAKLR